MDQSLGPPVEDNCDVPRQSIEQQDIPVQVPKKRGTTRGKKKYLRGKGPRAQMTLYQTPDRNPDIGETVDVEATTDMSHQETANEEMEANDRIPSSPAWGYSGRVDTTPAPYEHQAADGSLYQLLAGMIQRNDEISSEAIGLIRTQAADVCNAYKNADARLERKDAQVKREMGEVQDKHTREMDKLKDEHKQLLKHQREDFNRARTEHVNRWSYLLQEQKALRESSQDRWGTLVVGLILAFLVWVLNKVF